MALACENLACERGGRIIFQGLGFCLPEGGFLLAKGGNGAGKTTLIQFLAGLRPPGQGVVSWEGAPIARHKRFQEELTYIGDENDLKPRQTVERNLLRYARAKGAEAMLSGALRYFDLEDRRNARIAELSKGWKQRVMLARLLLSPGKLWLLDEPTNFLDPEAIGLLTSLIETRVKLGGIVVAASHTMNSSFAAHVLELGDFRPALQDSKK